MTEGDSVTAFSALAVLFQNGRVWVLLRAHRRGTLQPSELMAIATAASERTVSHAPGAVWP